MLELSTIARGREVPIRNPNPGRKINFTTTNITARKTI
jgi:hypothetical protein